MKGQIVKKILLIGGGNWQLSIAKKIKAAGHILICSNLYENSPCFALADHKYVIDVLDKESNLQIARLNEIDGVITDQSDIAVPTVAFVAEKMGLPGVGIDRAELFTNKYLMRSQLLNSSFEHPKYALVSDVDEALTFFNNQNDWIISKPLNNQSSRGVNLIKSIAQFDDAIKDTLNHSTSTFFLVEEYIHGQEITVEGFKPVQAKHKTLAISVKKHLTPYSNIACELKYQPDFEQVDRNQIEDAEAYIFDNVPFAITHSEFKIQNGKIYLIEAAIRGGGTKISSEIIPAVSGIDVNKLLIESVLGEHIEIQQTQVGQPFAILKFFNFPPGLVTNIVKPAKNDWPSEVLDFCLEFAKGDILSSPSDDRSRHGYMILSSKTSEGLAQAQREMEDAVKIETQVIHANDH